ncbi:phosphonate C-P lyase system protein PhnG [Microbacterium sp. A82]|uniref:phosphonate C-P lyase system protein PhnG n=1 Tax=Microbacterium sp. A82 TaxID=3450452 RepID=UPI003F3334AE
MTDSLTRAEITSELNMADAAAVIALSHACLADDADVVITRSPVVGTVVTQVREPVAEERFILGDVLVTQAEVRRRGVDGWTMRMGADRLAALAAAICATEYLADGPRSGEVVALCESTRTARETARAAEWKRLSASIVEFEEIP